MATAGLLASTAISLTGSHPDLAQLFAVKAYQLDPGNPQTRAALFAAVQSDPQVQRFLQAPGPVSALAVAPDGGTIVAGHQERLGTRLEPVRPSGRSARPDDRAGHRAWRSARTGPHVAATTGLAARTWVHGHLAASRAAPPGTPFTAAGVSPSGNGSPPSRAFPHLDVLSTPAPGPGARPGWPGSAPGTGAARR